MNTEKKCECGTIVRITITEGNNPGCKEREEVFCPNCNSLLHSGIYNDAFVSEEIVNNLKEEKAVIKKNSY